MMKYDKLKKILIFVTFLLSIQSSLAAEIVVNSAQTTIADDGFCTLYEAVASANDNMPSGVLPGECLAGEAFNIATDVITFDPGILPVTIEVPYSLLLTESVSITSPHQDLVVLQGHLMDRILKIRNTVAPCEFEIKGITFSNGLALMGQNPDFGFGGAIAAEMSLSTLLIDGVKFTNNVASHAGGALAILLIASENNITIKNSTFNENYTINTVPYESYTNSGGGGAIYIAQRQIVTIEDSTFFGNYTTTNQTYLDTSKEPGGGAILTNSSVSFPSIVTIRRSTFSGNKSVGMGGAIAVGYTTNPDNYSQVSLRHSTVVNNESDANLNNTGIFKSGGGIYSYSNSDTVVYNSIISDNLDNSTDPAHNITGTIDSLGYNLINNSIGALSLFPLGSPNANNDFSFLPAANISPGIEDLSKNGGLTKTHALLPNSMAIDSGNCPIASNDQRAHINPNTNLRTFDQTNIPNLSDGCDIGSFELGTESSNSPPVAVNDYYTILEDSTLETQENFKTLNFGLLDNDSDAETENDDLYILNAGVFEPNSIQITQKSTVDLGTDGLFTYTPVADENGVVFFSYEVSDGLNSSFALASINIVPVNDQPSFVVSQNSINVTQTGVPVVIPNWATQISNGPSNESSQLSQFQINVIQGNSGFFNQVPSIDVVTGDLSYEVSATATGIVELEITLRDNGGTAFGGIDTSEPQPLSFAINQNAPTVNIISPANSDTSTVGDSIVFSATANDIEDGDISNNLVWQSDIDGPIGSSGSFSSSSLSIGTHIITARVVDSSGLSAYQSVTIQVNNSVTAPTVTILSPADSSSFIVGDSINFLATATDAEDGNMTSQILWSSNLDGPLGNGGDIFASNLRIGHHTISAKVTDSSGLSAITSIAVVIVVNPTTNAPVLTIIQPTTGSEFLLGNPVSFSASAIDQEDGDISANIIWDSDIDGQIGIGGSFTLSSLSLGTHLIGLSVVDSNSNAVYAALLITITESISPPTVTLISPTDGSSFFENDVITFSATASDLEDGDISSQINWISNQIDGQFGTGGSFTYSSLTIGQHQIVASVVDSNGEIDSETLTIEIMQSPSAPDITIQSPAMNSNFQLGSGINFIASAFDNMGNDISSGIVWSTDTGQIGSGSNIIVNNLPIGIHTVSATVNDNGFNGIEQVVIEVTEPTLNVNIITPLDGDIFLSTETIIFTAEAFDSSGGDISPALNWTSSIDGFLGQGAAINTNNLSIGEHEINITVIDGVGNAGAASINITLLDDKIFENGFE